MITFNIDIEKATRDILRYSQDIGHYMRELIQRLMDEGYEIADAGFRNAQYAGRNDVNVSLPRWEEENTLVLEASGNSVAFIEFGTGVTQPEYPEPKFIANVGAVDRGEYDKKHGANPPWYYEGDRGNLGRKKRNRDGTYSDRWNVTWGNPPARAMYNASKVFDKDHVMQIAKEVFNK